MSKSEYLVEMNDISVEFPGVKALDGVKFNAIPGEVHVLLGENGAGKSTIMKVLAGVNTNYKGTIIWKGEEIVSRSIDEQRSRGVGIIFQELNLLKNLTVAENMFLGRQPTTATGNIDWKKMNQEARKLPVFFDAGLIILIPLAFSIARRAKKILSLLCHPAAGRSGSWTRIHSADPWPGAGCQHSRR